MGFPLNSAKPTSDHGCDVPYLKTITNDDPVIGRSLLLIAIIVGFGTAGYTWIEGWSPWRSLFFTLVTLTTVGYGDYGLSESGERFTAILMIGGIGTVSYAASRLLQRGIVRAAHPERRTMQQAKRMHDHYIVCGTGRTGRRVIDRLLADQAQVIAIDTSHKDIEELREKGVIALEGDATLDDTLFGAGIERASAIAAVTSTDAINALICLSARALAPDIRVIARAEHESSAPKLRRAGADAIITPAQFGGDGIARQMRSPHIARLMPGLDAADDAIEFTEFVIDETSPLCGRRAGDLGAEHPSLIFVAVQPRGGEFRIRPNPDHTFAEGDILIIAGQREDVERLEGVRRAAA